MIASLLVVTPHASFGELIRQSLEETRSYRVHIVDDAESAVSCLKEQGVSMAFLDMDLKDASVLEIGLALRKINADLDLVIISNADILPALDEIRPWKLLRKPFYLPNLLNMLDKAPLKKAVPRDDVNLAYNPEEDEDNLPWLRDATKAAQHLTRLTLESSAQAALIVRQRKLWAYAGQLSQTAASELAGTAAQHKKAGDLLRFIRLEATQAEHMLYVVQLAEGVTLAMVFDAETPFSTIRNQANHLVESLSISTLEADNQTLNDTSEPATSDLDNGSLPPISEILENIPDPNPGGGISLGEPSRPSLSETIPFMDASEAAQMNSAAETRPSTPIRPTPAFSRESSPAIPVNNVHATGQQPEVEIEETSPQELPGAGDLEVTRISKSLRPETPLRRPQPGKLDETRPHSITEVTGRVVLEPSSSGLYNLTYACLLVPRFGSHYLAGDLAEGLSEWIPTICVAFGWRLDYLSVRPAYLQWVIDVPPTTSPGYLMRIMRQQTSDRIFEDFPRLKRENPSGDFWAPGYLIMGGSQPHPSKLVNDYIKRTRKRQGVDL